jgi:DNA-binding MarR family transcriptional regulator
VSAIDPREPRVVRRSRNLHLNLLLLANRANEAVERLCRDAGLTHPQYVVLWTLCLTDEPETGIPIGAVTDGLLTRASDATRLVDRMERAGLVERLPNPADRRSVLVRATAAGREAFAAVTPRLQAFHRVQWKALDADELATLDHLVGKALWASD